MDIVSENLVVISRQTTDGTIEVLTAMKKRGRFAGKETFPGGKAEESHSQISEAVREVGEETGIPLRTSGLRSIGKLLIRDMRPGQERFGNVFIYTAEVNSDTEPIETAELGDLRWRNVNDPDLAANMPPDVELWWPAVRGLADKTIVTHVTYEQDGTLDVIVKEPDFANSRGKIIRHERFTTGSKSDQLTD